MKSQERTESSNLLRSCTGNAATAIRWATGCTIALTGDVTAFSAAWFNTEVATISNALGLVNNLRGVSFKRIDSGNRGIGVIAQELAAVVPEAVQVNDDGLLSVDYGNLVGVLIEAVKELSGKVERLEARA